MNFIFDIGNVLVHYQPVPFLASLFPERRLADKIYETIFASPEWEKMDQGLLTHRQAAEVFCSRAPEHASAVITAMNRLCDMLTPVHDTVALLPRIKADGHSLYYLSNYHRELRDYILSHYDFFALFDGGVFSCDVNLLKPSPAIYQLLLKQYRLEPASCLFFDDVPENVRAAREAGIRSVLFTGAACVKPYLDELRQT